MKSSIASIESQHLRGTFGAEGNIVAADMYAEKTASRPRGGSIDESLDPTLHSTRPCSHMFPADATTSVRDKVRPSRER